MNLDTCARYDVYYLLKSYGSASANQKFRPAVAQYSQLASKLYHVLCCVLAPLRRLLSTDLA